MWRQLTMQRLTLVILFVMLFVMAVRTPVDTDTWWHLRVGEYQLEHETIVGADLFSHTRAGAEWLNHSWGSQIIMYLVYAGSGGNGQPGDSGNIGLALLTALLATAGMAFVYLASPGNIYVKAFALVLGAATAAVFWSPRPHMFSFLASAIVFYLLDLYKSKRIDRLWLVPVVVLVWGNLHGGFAIAFVLMLGFIAGAVASNLFNQGEPDVLPWRGVGRLLVILAVSVVALIVNPFGPRLLTVPFATVNIGVLQNFIQEWASPNFHERQTWPFIFMLVGALGFAGLSRKRLDWTDLALVSGTAFMSLLAGRNIALFAVVTTPVLARHVDAFLADRGWQVRPTTRLTPTMLRLNWLVLVVILLAGFGKVVYAVNPAGVARAQQERLPVEVAAFINDSRPEGQMFNSYNWGGYLMFAVPDMPVFVDGRTDLYGDDFLTEYLSTVFLREGWRETFDRHDVSWIVIEANSILASALREEPEWAIAYEDSQAVLFEREGDQ